MKYAYMPRMWHWMHLQHLQCLYVFRTTGVMTVVCLLGLCCNSGIICGHPVGFQWSVKISGHFRNRIVLFWVPLSVQCNGNFGKH